MLLHAVLLTSCKGVVPPSPACARALDMVVEAVRLRGDHVIELSDFPSAYEALKTAGILLNADGGKTFLGHFRSFFEGNDAGVSRLVFFFKLPSFIRSIYTFWVRHVRRDELWAGLLESWSEKTVAQQWELVVKREAIRAQWHRYWGEQEIDFILMPPHALPAVPERGMKNSVAACGYTFIWNLVRGRPSLPKYKFAYRVIGGLYSGSSTCNTRGQEERRASGRFLLQKHECDSQGCVQLL